MYRIVVADNNRVDLSVSGINTIGVVPESVDELTALVIVAEQETVESMQTTIALCLTPYSSCLVLVWRIGWSLNVTGITR